MTNEKEDWRPIKWAFEGEFDWRIDELGIFKGADARANDINNNGDIVGWVQHDNGIGDAFIYNGGTLSFLPSLGHGHST